MLLGSSADSHPGQDTGTWTQDTGMWTDRVHTHSQEVLGCAHVNCTCDAFQPGKCHLRSCDRCSHGWVTHAVSKLGLGVHLTPGQVEVVEPPVVFDISSVLLYGTQAIPVRMKILLDRLFSVLTHTQVLTILHTLGWTLRDYIRGYILQDSVGKVLDRWVTMSLEDEIVALHHFMRFGETKCIVEFMVAQEQQGHLAAVSRATRADSDILLFAGSLNHMSQTSAGKGGHRPSGETLPSLHQFEDIPGVSRDFLQPLQYSGPSRAPPLLPFSAFLQEASADACRLQQTKQTKQNHGRITTETEVALANRSSRQTSTVGRSTAEDRRGMQAIGERTHGASDTLHWKKQANKQVPLTNSDDPCSSSSSSVTCIRSPGSSMRKGRVSCGTCGKTFYDKGTLKIHYNAVHLKLKHCCTIEGCNMVFSSLRSRNRHSANPNPRLHTPALQATPSPSTPSQLTAPARLTHTALPCRIRPPLGTSHPGAPHLPPSNLEAPHTQLIAEPSCETVLSPRRPPELLPQKFAVSKPVSNTAVTDHLEKLYTCICDSKGAPETKGLAVTPLTTNQSRFITTTHTVLKKKSRKSSMPVKIKRETLSEQDSHDNRGHDSRVHDNDYDKSRTMAAM